MSDVDSFVSSDRSLMKLLRKAQRMTVAEMADEMGVTATAIRQRLNRLLAQGYVERSSEAAGRGRPVHRYALTTSGRRMSGVNFGDLAVALWEELRAIKDVDVRRGLLKRVSQRMASMYEDVVEGDDVAEKMESLAELFEQRQIPFEVQRSEDGDGEDLPILTALACPYPELAEQDRGICAMERILISEVVGQDVRLSKCRLDGDACCSFEPTSMVSQAPATG